MKYLLAFLLIFSFRSYSQIGYPIIQPLGSDSSVINAKGALKSRIINRPFVDTAEANQQRIKWYEGAQIWTTSDKKFRVRDSVNSIWLLVGGGGTGGNDSALIGFRTVTEDTLRFGLDNGDSTDLLFESINLVKTVEELRNLSSTPSTDVIYKTTDYGTGEWIWDPVSVADDNTGTVLKIAAITTGRLKRIYSGYINALWFGFVLDWNGSAGTDNLVSWGKLKDYTESLADYSNAVAGVGFIPTVYIPHGAGFYVSDSVSLGKGVGLMMYTPLISGVDITKTALTLGSPLERTYGADFRIMVRKAVQSDWSDSADITSVGVRMYNMSNCNIHLQDVMSFTLGVDLVGQNTGFTDNKNMSAGAIHANKIGIRKFSKAPNGYVNENKLEGGQIAVAGGINPGKGRIGILITSDYAYYSNNNTFISPSFQLTQSAATPGEALPFLMEYSGYNHVYNIRTEGNGDYIARILNNSTENKFIDGYGLFELDDQSTGKTNYVSGGTQGLDPGLELYTSGPLHKLASQYTSSSVHVPGQNFVTSSGSLINRSSPTWSIHPNYLASSGGGMYIGVFVTTDRVKRFVVRKDTDSGYGGRIFIACYDVNGNIMTNAHANSPLVRGANFGNAWTFNAASLGGSWAAGSDVDGDMYFVIDTAVHKIRLMLASAAGMRIRSYGIYALTVKEKSLGATVFSGYDEIAKFRNLATAVPTVGSYDRGKVVWNDAPTDGQPVFWTNKTAGTFGTLTGVTGSITSGDVLLTVNDADDLEIGQYINIVGVTSTKLITAINGLVITIHASADATVAGAAVSFQAPDFSSLSLGGGLIFTSPGNTLTGSTVTNDAITGLPGGLTILGGTASGTNLKLRSNTSNDGRVSFGNAGTSYYDEAANVFRGITQIHSNSVVSVSGLLSLIHRQDIAVGIALTANAATTLTSGSHVTFKPGDNFAPTSGTATHYGIEIGNTHTINQTGGANGITGGIHITPTLTSAADFRALFIENNSHYGIYQSGASAKNYFNGSTGFGVATADASAQVDISSTTKGFLIPRMTEAQRDAVSSPANGLMIYNTTSGKFNFREAGAWSVIGAGGGGAWGTITGTLSDQTDLQSELDDRITEAVAAATYAVIGHTHTFASLTSKPTTLAGYGITDAYPLTGNPSGFLTAISTLQQVSDAGNTTTTHISGRTLSLTNTVVGSAPLTITGAAGQTGNLVNFSDGSVVVAGVNPTGALITSEQAAPATVPLNNHYIYAKTDNLLYSMDENEVETKLSNNPRTVVNQTSVTYNATATSGELVIFANTASNAITVNLPTAVGNTAWITIKKINSSANNVTIDGATTETIDGGTTAVLQAQYESITLVSDGSNWQII